MSAAMQVHGIGPKSVNVEVIGRFALGKIRTADLAISLFPVGASTTAGSANRDLGTLAKIGEALAREARRAGHAERTRRRTAELYAAVDATKQAAA